MSEKIYLEITSRINTGTITDATKEELEKYAAELCKSGANTSFGSIFHAVCGTIRTLLIVRMSEESNKEATKISKIALIVAVVALFVTVIQTIVSAWPLWHPTLNQGGEAQKGQPLTRDNGFDFSLKMSHVRG